MLLLSELSDLQGRQQDDLFPYLEERLGPLAPSYQLLVAIFEMAPVAAAHARTAAGRSGAAGTRLHRQGRA